MADGGEDPFDGVIWAEESLRQEGYEAGYRNGVFEGKISGYVTGQNKGMEVGDELGFYLGFAQKLLELKVEGRDKLNRLLSSLVADIREFRCLDLNYSGYQEDMSKIRARFRQISSMLKFKEPEKFGQSKRSF